MMILLWSWWSWLWYFSNHIKSTLFPRKDPSLLYVDLIYVEYFHHGNPDYDGSFRDGNVDHFGDLSRLRTPRNSTNSTPTNFTQGKKSPRWSNDTVSSWWSNGFLGGSPMVFFWSPKILSPRFHTISRFGWFCPQLFAHGSSAGLNSTRLVEPLISQLMLRQTLITTQWPLDNHQSPINNQSTTNQ